MTLVVVAVLAVAGIGVAATAGPAPLRWPGQAGAGQVGVGQAGAGQWPARGAANAGQALAPGPVAPVPTASLPPDQPLPQGPPSSGSGCPPTRAPGWLAAENARTGPVLPAGALSPSTRTPALAVLGYAGTSSARCGDVVPVSLSGPEQQVRLAAYRLGWYSGAGSRLVWRSDPVAVDRQPWSTGDPGTHLVEPHWLATVRIPITGAWTPGLYALIPETAPASSAAVAVTGPSPAAAAVPGPSPAPVAGAPAGTDAGGDPVGPVIPLVVRDDTGHEPVLAMESTLTWNAYGDWGGFSLYDGPAAGSDDHPASSAQRFAQRARAVALQRPLTGAGYQQLAAMDVPVARWLESLGQDVAYTTDVAVDQRPSQLLQHGELVVGGHSEYWTGRMFDGLEAAIGRGVNVALLGANNVWWHARLEAGGTREVVYKDAIEDPLSNVDDAQVSALWTQWPSHRDFAAVSGESHAGIAVRGSLELLQPPGWITAGTSLTDGSLLGSVVGNEADGVDPHAPHPDHLEVIAAGVLRGGHGPVLVSTTYVTAPGGAAIFAAGTTDWACALEPPCPGGIAPPATVDAVRAITRNVVLGLAEPYAGLRHPVQPWPVPTARQYLQTRQHPATGTYGSATEAEPAASDPPNHQP